MAIDSNVLQEVIDALKQDPEIKNNVYQATVSRIDGEGVVWVNIAGSDTETPTAITSAEVAPGDAVNVEWRNNKLYIGGNYSNPSAGVVRVEAVEAATQVANEAAANAVQDASRARTAAESAEASATEAKETADAVHGIAVQAQEEAVRAGQAADRAEGKADDAAEAAERAEGEAVRAGNAANRAEGKADAAQASATTANAAANSALVSLSTVEDVVGVLNWITEHGTMTLTSDVTVNPAHVYFVVDPAGDYVVGGTHYSIVSEPDDADISTYYELSVDESVENYVATHLAVDSEGLWIIPDAGGNKVLIATGSGSSYTTAGTYIVGKVNGVEAVFAKFTADGTTMQRGSTDIAHLGYGPGTSSDGGTADAPYYTFGERSSGSVGNYSTVEGYRNISTGYASHVEGVNNYENYGYRNHVEGRDNTTEQQTGGSADTCHIEGRYCSIKGTADGHAIASHVQNIGTKLQACAQTAIGRYNNPLDSTDGTALGQYGTYALYIGNGTADNARSNALTVDWNGGVDAKGDVNIASGKHYKINGTNLSASDVGALASTTTYVSGVKGNAESSYRSGNVNVTPANVGAVALADKYTRSSGGTLDWSTQTEGDSKVIAKSALAFWNGAYSGNSSNLSKCSTGNIIGSNGGTMTGQLKTSFKTSVAMGSYGSAQTTVDGLVGEVRFSSGCAGSASINTAYTKSGVTIPTGWYNYFYMPHRSGGNSGAADGDNANYGNLFLFGMNNTNGRFIVRVSSGSVADVCRIWTSLETVDYVVEQGTSGIWTYRKWNSKVAECWGVYSASIAVNTTSAAYGGYRSAEITATAYPFTFAATPVVTATCGAGSNGASVVNIQPSTASNCKFYLGSGASMAAASRSIHIHAIGKTS